VVEERKTIDATPVAVALAMILTAEQLEELEAKMLAQADLRGHVQRQDPASGHPCGCSDEVARLRGDRSGAQEAIRIPSSSRSRHQAAGAGAAQPIHLFFTDNGFGTRPD
jgi:hypothetical protein